MKKLFLIGLLTLTVACQPAESTPAPESTPTTAPPPTLTSVPATQTLIPTPIFSPTPPPPYFIESFDTFAPYWKTITINGQATSSQFQSQNGNLVINPLTSNTWVYALYDLYVYQNSKIDVLFQINDGAPYMIGVVCMYDESAGWFEYDISSDGTYSVLYGQWLADGIAQFTPLAYDSSEYIKPDQSQYELGFECKDNFLSLSINGKLFRRIDVSSYELTEGKTGITVSSFEDPNITISVDSLEITEP